MEKDQEFLEYVVKKIVSHPDEVETDRSVDERGVLLSLSVHPDDMGHVIGRQGQTARALRTLLKIVGAQNNARVNLKIEEPEGSERAEDDSNASSTEDSEEDIDTSAVDDLDI